MKRFIIEPDFWELFPKAQIGILVAQGIDNQPQLESFEPMLRQAEQAAKQYLTEDVFSTNEVIAVWRDAFQKFKTKKGARSSIEALLKRVERGDELATINPLVDLYNAISLTYGLPCGGEDLDAFVGDIRLTKANGDEPFITLGSEESAPPYAGEIVYKDDEGAICRCWNWRESVRTMLRPETKNAFLCIELVDDRRQEVLLTALNDLKAHIESHLGGKVKLAILEKSKPEIKLEL